MKNYLELLEDEMKLRGLSKNSMRIYLLCMKDYFDKVDNPEVFDLDKLKGYLVLRIKNGLNNQTANLYLSAIKFFYRHVIGYNEIIPIKYSRKSQYVPVVFTVDEIKYFFNRIKNRKHKLAMKLTYGAGLRVTEVVKLRVRDLNFDSKIIYIRQSKGKKDRITILPEILYKDLVDFVALKNPKDYLFESERGGRLTSRTLQQVFKNIVMKTFPDKKFTYHSLRHSFATHLLNSGVSIRHIQEMLGHTNIVTTMKYLQVSQESISNLKSPLEFC